MSATFEPLVDCDSGTPAAPAVIKPLTNPWAAAIDATTGKGAANLGELALGQNITQTPEYQAANLPPYRGGSSGSFLSHFLL